MDLGASVRSPNFPKIGCMENPVENAFLRPSQAATHRRSVGLYGKQWISVQGAEHANEALIAAPPHRQTRREDGAVQLSVGAGQKYILPVGRARRFWARPGGQAGVTRTRGTKWGMKNAILGRCAPHDYGLRFT